jgi:HAD superfamily hydrolase (TIGR01490 family)
VPLALFDVDHTLVAGSTLAGFFSQLKRMVTDQDLITRVQALEARAAREGYGDHAKLVRTAFGLLVGQELSLAYQVGRAWFEENGRADLIEVTGARLRAHQRAGQTVVFVSGSWLPSLAPIAEFYDVEHVLCCRPDHQNGVLTGTVPYVAVGDGKVRAVREFIAAQHFDLEASVAYGDDPTDIPMLEMVAHPVVVGSNPTLAHVAHERGWDHIQLPVQTPRTETGALPRSP